MKRLIIAAATAALTLSMGTEITLAQDGGAPEFRPLEIWACSFRDRKDQDDLSDVYERLVEANGDDAYAAFQLNSYFRGANQDFDFLYVGVWQDGTTMGSNLTNYFENNSDVDAAWEETADCPTSTMYASTRIQSPGDGDGNFILTVSDCNIGHGISPGQAIGALQRFNSYRVANGSTVGTIAWFPVYGGGGAEFDIKLVNTFSSLQHFGDTFQWFVDNQAYLVQQEMTNGILDCDEARVYMGSTIMNNMAQD